MNERVIEFRAWNKVEEKMYFGVENTYDGRIPIDDPILEPCFGAILQSEDWTVMQYTGLQDRNGKEIYEGDIITNEWCFIYYPSIVRFGRYKSSDMSSYYECGHLGFYIEHPCDKLSRKDILYFANQCEVIGNIYENPELLEVDE